MLRSPLFWKLFLGFMLTNLLATGALLSATWGWQRDKATALTYRELDTVAEMLAEAAAEWAKEPSDATAAELDHSAERARVDLIVTNAAGETHEARGAGSSEGGGGEPSPAPMSVLRSLHSGDKSVGELRVERPGDTLSATLGDLWLRYVGYMPLLALAMVAAGYGLVTHLVAPVRALRRAVEGLAKGGYHNRAFVTNRDELGDLARSFNQVSQELGDQLEELRESDRHQATVLGGMIEGVIAIDDRGHVLLANRAAGELFDFLPPEAFGRPLIESVRSDSLHQASKAAIATQTPQRLEIEWEEHTLSAQVTPLVGQSATGAVLVLHDTTTLRRLENLRRDFVANVSHELKTPLATIKANAETLIRGAVDDPEFRDRFLSGIVDQSDTLAGLIQDMLNLARIESAQQPYEIAALSVAEMAEACLRENARRATSKGIALSIGSEGSEPPADALVRADRKGMRVILNNLVDNAIKYTPEGGAVWITWSIGEPATPGSVRIEVNDNGIGIPEEKLSRVFERFFRVDEARSRDLGGTGLGLSIVKHLCQSFGGSVSVANREEGGASFAVTLAVGEETPAEAQT